MYKILEYNTKEEMESELNKLKVDYFVILLSYNVVTFGSAVITIKHIAVLSLSN